MSFGFLLPVTFGVLAFGWWRKTVTDLNAREALLYAATTTGVYLVIITETLSAFRALTFGGVVSAWTAGCVVLLLLNRRTGSAANPVPAFRFPAFFSHKEPFERVLLFLILLSAGLTALVAFVGVPNTYDAMTYHLARVAHWLQNRSVAIYATGCMYQNQHSPWAEWSMLHLALLQGNDHLVAFVQWTSFAGCLVAVSLLTEKCGGSKRAGLIAAFLAATLPMAILQASSTQNDEVLGFWLLCFAYGCLQAGENPTRPRLILCGASLGLALLTKALAYLFAPALGLGLAIMLLRRGPRFALPRLLLVVLIALVLNAGYFLRNWTSSGTLLGSEHDSGPGYGYENEIHTPAALVSNIIRNLSLQMPQLPGVTVETYETVDQVHAALGLDPADPRTSSYAPYYYIPPWPDETQCANPLHLLAIGLSFGLLLALRRRFSGNVRFLAASVLAGALLFCFVLKWQPFHSRLHLPLLLLALPVVAVVWETLQLRLLTLLFLGLMLAGACFPLLANRYHPLLGAANIFVTSPAEQRFVIRLPEIRDEYARALQLFRQLGVKSIGVVSPADNSGWEYPLFDPDHMKGGLPWRVEQVRVQNIYAPLETPSLPDAVVVLWPAPEEVFMLHQHSYHRVLTGDALSVYLP